MEFQHLQYMKELANAQGLAVNIIPPPYENIQQFDAGLREQIYRNYDYGEIIKQLSYGRERTVYLLSDNFNVHYIFFKQPRTSTDEEPVFVVIGPYLSHDYREVFTEVHERLKLPPFQAKELKEYYSEIPCYDFNDSPEIWIMVMASYIFGGNDFDVDRSSLFLQEDPNAYEVRLEPEHLLSYKLIEERYGIEDALLDAVERGDLKQAIYHKNQMHKYKIEPRNSDSLRNSKNLCITFNSLLRKAVQRGGVHPAYIDSVSSGFARSIEAVTKEADLGDLLDEMVRKYCRLVQKYSLSKYSKNVQKALNYIDFNYTEQISLSLLSEIASTNANYLSTLFKKETGTTVTEYINQLRIHRSLPLLATTDLPINIVAEKVGFLDDNYYTRVFKKYMQKSPREYRKSFR